MLESLFGQPPPEPVHRAGDDNSLVSTPLRRRRRTNSIASGSTGDLAVVEAILLSSMSEVRARKSVVYKLACKT